MLYGGSRRGAKPPPRKTAQSRKPQQSTHQRRQTPPRPPAPRRAFQTRHRNAPYAINAAPITTGISISANHNANAATANPAAITATAIATRNTFVAHGVGGGPRNCPSGVMSKTLPAPDSFPRLMMIFMPSKWPPPTPRSRAPSLSFGHPKKPRPRPLTSLPSRSGGSRRGAQPHKPSQPSAGLSPTPRQRPSPWTSNIKVPHPKLSSPPRPPRGEPEGGTTAQTNTTKRRAPPRTRPGPLRASARRAEPLDLEYQGTPP